MIATRTNPSVTEIVGVAGAGKSTVTRTLVGRHGRLRVDDTLHIRLPGHWFGALRGTIRGLPVMAAGLIGSRRLRWDDLRFVLYVGGWSRRVARRRPNDEVLLLDQGPVFALARLRVSGAAVTRTAVYRRWEAAMIADWARMLDLVLWLDAPDNVITTRINCRDQPHDIKGASPAYADGFLSGYRHAYDAIIGRFERASRGPRVVRMDSSLVGAAELAEEVERILGLGRRIPDERAADAGGR